MSHLHRNQAVTPAALERRLVALARGLNRRRWTLTTAESCTGGWLAKVVTDLAGSSEWFQRGLVTYGNQAKVDLLGVDAGTLDRHGAVSARVAEEMAVGARQRAGADLAVAITGIAGPTGGSRDKPVGTVWFGVANGAAERDSEAPPTLICHREFSGDREAVRWQSVVLAVELLQHRCRDPRWQPEDSNQS